MTNYLIVPSENDHKIDFVLQFYDKNINLY